MTQAPIRRRQVLALLPLALLGLIHMLDHVQFSRSWDLPTTAALDWPAHLATAVLLLLTVVGPAALVRYQTFALSTCIGSVAIDLDHLPLYAHLPYVSVGGRPFTHSIATVVVLLLSGQAARGNTRTIVFGLSFGVFCHLYRDIATGPGIPIWWPIEPSGAHEIPYTWYSQSVYVLAAVACIRGALSRPNLVEPAA